MCTMHSYAAQLMETRGEQYVHVERDENLGINIQFRIHGIFRRGEFNCRFDEMELSIGRSFGLGGQGGM